MKIRHQHQSEKIELEMTPMIDIVFQLLIFFIMTFKIVDVEGDFNIKMPLASVSSGEMEEDLVPPMKVRITAGGGGQLASVALNGRTLFGGFDELHTEMMNLIGDDAQIQESAEVEFDCDYNLRYENVISGYRTDSGEVVKLVEKIKFAAPRPGG